MSNSVLEFVLIILLFALAYELVSFLETFLFDRGAR